MSTIQQLLTEHLDIWTAADTGPKSGRGRSSANAAKVYGISKLRELILELAVRGKLVPQDADDEPASELLKRIRAEKAELVIDGKLKKEKPLPPITKGATAYEVPPSWEWVNFGDIAQHNSGKTLDNGRNTGELRDYITTSNLYWGYFELTNLRQMPITVDELDRCLAKKGDLLICEGGEAGRAAVWTYDRDICIQNHVHRARLFGGINPYYAYRFFEKLNATGEINEHRKGVAISNMSGKALASISFPLPSITEQHRIVAKVDELMALCDQLESEHNNATEAHEKLVSHLLGTLTQSQSAEDFSANWQRIATHFDTLFTTEASIDALKQTLLQLAVMGKLVPQDSNDEPASELLKRIQVEKTRLIAAGKIKKDKPLEPITENEESFELPTGWVWSRLQSIFDVRDGTHDTPKYYDAGFPLITSKNLYTGRLDFTDIKYISGEDHIKIKERSGVDRGDILFAMIGSIGNPVIVESDVEFSIKNVALFKPYSNHLCEMNYLLRYLLTASVSMREEAAGAVQSFVSLGILRNYVFPMPPLAEQRRIVAKLNELMVLCDQLKARLTAVGNLQRKLADIMVESAVA